MCRTCWTWVQNPDLDEHHADVVKREMRVYLQRLLNWNSILVHAFKGLGFHQTNHLGLQRKTFFFEIGSTFICNNTGFGAF